MVEYKIKKRPPKPAEIERQRIKEQKENIWRIQQWVDSLPSFTPLPTSRCSTPLTPLTPLSPLDIPRLDLSMLDVFNNDEAIHNINQATRVVADGPWPKYPMVYIAKPPRPSFVPRLPMAEPDPDADLRRHLGEQFRGTKRWGYTDMDDYLQDDSVSDGFKLEVFKIAGYKCIPRFLLGDLNDDKVDLILDAAFEADIPQHMIKWFSDSLYDYVNMEDPTYDGEPVQFNLQPILIENLKRDYNLPIPSVFDRRHKRPKMITVEKMLEASRDKVVHYCHMLDRASDYKRTLDAYVRFVKATDRSPLEAGLVKIPWGRHQERSEKKSLPISPLCHHSYSGDSQTNGPQKKSQQKVKEKTLAPLKLRGKEKHSFVAEQAQNVAKVKNQKAAAKAKIDKPVQLRGKSSQKKDTQKDVKKGKAQTCSKPAVSKKGEAHLAEFKRQQKEIIEKARRTFQACEKPDNLGSSVSQVKAVYAPAVQKRVKPYEGQKKGVLPPIGLTKTSKPPQWNEYTQSENSRAYVKEPKIHGDSVLKLPPIHSSETKFIPKPPKAPKPAGGRHRLNRLRASQQ